MSSSGHVRLRFAPSPTGTLHVGGARTALLNYLYAKAHNGTFVLRIEDTDQKRFTDESEKEIFSALDWLGLKWDEGPGFRDPDRDGHFKEKGEFGPYRQSQRLSVYKEALETLKMKNAVYPCFCTPEDLKNRTESSYGVYDGRCLHLSQEEVKKFQEQGLPFAYRLKVPSTIVTFHDMVRGEISTDMTGHGDFILMKSDGFPAYNFACAVDDTLMKVSHVLRGDDHISNTSKQILIYRALEKELPVFGHISMILGENREKLSKRHGAVSISEFKRSGYLPEALINHLVLLGWSSGDDREIFSMNDLVESFKSPRFTHAPAVFSYGKLDYLNSHYIKEANSDRINALLKEHVKNAYPGFESDERIDKILKIVRPRLKKLSDVSHFIPVFLDQGIEISQDHDEFMRENSEVFRKGKDFFDKSVEYSSADDFKEFMKVCKKSGIKGKGFFMPVRLALTGEEHGMELNDIITLIKNHVIVRRFEKAEKLFS